MTSRRVLVPVLLALLALVAACDAQQTAPDRPPDPKLVFAHYFPPLPMSLDNRDPAVDYYELNYLTPHGESGKHAAYGGYLRDRPLPRPKRGTDWRLEDLQVEVRQAIEGQLDGFALDIIQFPDDQSPHQVTTMRTLMKAAESVDPNFKIMLMLDMSGDAKFRSPSEVAAFVAELGASTSAYRLNDGRLVVSAFMAESVSVAWWNAFLDLMRSTYNLPVAFVPTFLDERLHHDAFAPISHGMGNWGDRNPVANDAATTAPSSHVGRVANVHALGKRWMQPVSIQDARPREGLFQEAENTHNLRNTWQIARRSGAEWVQLTTWNDYSETTHFAPSVKHGHGFLDLNSYYVSWYKTGSRPKVLRDTIYLTHRLQPWAAAPGYGQSIVMQPSGPTPARDTVEALTFLTAPGSVVVTSGTESRTCEADAGEATCVVPLSTGAASAVVTRNGESVASVTSPHDVTAAPYVQDLQYVIATSSRPAPHLEVTR